MYHFSYRNFFKNGCSKECSTSEDRSCAKISIANNGSNSGLIQTTKEPYGSRELNFARVESTTQVGQRLD